MGRRTAPSAEGAERFRAKRHIAAMAADHNTTRAGNSGGTGAVRRRGDVFLGTCQRRRRRGGLQLYELLAAWGATGQLSAIWLGLWVSASGGAAQSASIFT